MEKPDSTTKDHGTADSTDKPEPAAEPVDTPKTENNKEPEIPIRQVPMDGICGGY